MLRWRGSWTLAGTVMTWQTNAIHYVVSFLTDFKFAAGLSGRLWSVSSRSTFIGLPSLFFVEAVRYGNNTRAPTKVQWSASVLGFHPSSVPTLCWVQKEDFCLGAMLFPKRPWWERWKPSSLNCTSSVVRLEQVQLLRVLRRRVAYFKWKVFSPAVPSAFTLIPHLNR